MLPRLWQHHMRLLIRQTPHYRIVTQSKSLALSWINYDQLVMVLIASSSRCSFDSFGRHKDFLEAKVTLCRCCASIVPVLCRYCAGIKISNESQLFSISTLILVSVCGYTAQNFRYCCANMFQNDTNTPQRAMLS